MGTFYHLARQASAELALLGGVAWVWFGQFFTPDALAEYQHLLQLGTTAIVFVLACYRAWRVLVGGDPPRTDIGASR